MSLEELKSFSKKVVEDAELKKKAKEVGMENVDGLIALAKENGFNVSKEDFEKAAKEAQSSGELNEEDLEQVAGGAVTAGAVAGGVAAGAAVTQTTQSGGW